MGELIKNNHTFVVPGGETYTFAMNWTYDSWNRLQKMTYPDGEVVDYKYNLGGQLYSVSGTKTTRSYNYLNSVTYDKYGNRYNVENGNGTSLKYTYNQTTLRLSNLKSYNGFGEMMQNIDYKCDNVSNITQIKNNAPVMTNGLGGNSQYDYQYDDLYRLENASGSWDRNTFSLAMQYSASGNIPARLQQHIASGKLLPGTSVKRTEVLGGKTAREIAEQLRINTLGGIKNLENIRNPIGPARRHLLP